MRFTWSEYERLICLLQKNQYAITNYIDYKSLGKQPCVILRHDIDNSIGKAYEMAGLESSLGVASTYFVMLTSEFYNVAAAENTEKLKEIHEMGHTIGLHFDEKKYRGLEEERIKREAEKERKILEELLEMPIRAVSMHRPSKRALEADWDFQNMVNSYGLEFFKGFKYISDSRMCWQEDVEGIIQSCQYKRLHILTHAFWYEERERGIKQKLEDFICAAGIERYGILSQNFRNLEEFVKGGDGNGTEHKGNRQEGVRDGEAPL